MLNVTCASAKTWLQIGQPISHSLPAISDVLDGLRYGTWLTASDRSWEIGLGKCRNCSIRMDQVMPSKVLTYEPDAQAACSTNRMTSALADWAMLRQTRSYMWARYIMTTALADWSMQEQARSYMWDGYTMTTALTDWAMQGQIRSYMWDEYTMTTALKHHSMQEQARSYMWDEYTMTTAFTDCALQEQARSYMWDQHNNVAESSRWMHQLCL